MVPSPVSPELEGLTQCEEMLIARAFPIMQVYLKPKYGTTSYKGHVVTLPHNVQNIANILPRCPEDLPFVVFSVRGQNNEDTSFKVRRSRVHSALIWLKGNNVLYQNITIDLARVNVLPSDGFLNIPHNFVDDNTDTTPYDCGPSEASSVHEDVVSSRFSSI